MACTKGFHVFLGELNATKYWLFTYLENFTFCKKSSQNLCRIWVDVITLNPATSAQSYNCKILQLIGPRCFRRVCGQNRKGKQEEIPDTKIYCRQFFRRVPQNIYSALSNRPQTQHLAENNCFVAPPPELEPIQWSRATAPALLKLTRTGVIPTYEYDTHQQ
jgi:hypothetical protein